MPEMKSAIVTLLDLALLVGIVMFCWHGYREQRWWPRGAVQMMFRLLAGRGFWVQLFTLGPLTMLWMFICRAVNGLGWHATAAGGIVLGFTLVLDAMRMIEEDQKAQRASRQPTRAKPPSSKDSARPEGRSKP